MRGVRDGELPSGVVSLLFSDIEGSTRLLQQLGDLYGNVLAEHDRLLRCVWAAHGGIEVEREGDAFVVAFDDPSAAVRAAVEAQRALDGHGWPHGGSLRVRMGVHTGLPKVRDGLYWGLDVHYAARLCAAANGAQVLVSESTATLVDVPLEDLGQHALKDFPAPRRLFHLLVDGRGSDLFAPVRTLRTGRTNLPDQLSSFIGRERELDEVCALLAETRLVTVVGAGGVGKTRLTLAAAARLLDGSGDGVWLVELAALRDPDLVVVEVARVLGVSAQAGRAGLDSLVDAVRNRRLLLVLDNCEHLVRAAADLVVALAARCPGIVTLASSREPLGVPGERVYRMPSMSLPRPDERSPEDSEAVRLFVDRAREHRPGFAIDEGNAEAVAMVVRRLDGIPLAIELAAARLRSLGIGELQARLEQSFRLLTGGSRTALERQQTLRALFDWSYELLSARERAVLSRLSVFAGGFDLEAAEAVCASDRIDEIDVVDLLGALVDKSLVQVDDLGQRLRYRLLETVRDYAAGKLAESGEREREAIRRAHRDYYLALAEIAEPRLEARDQLEWLERLEAEHDNLRSALQYCLEDEDPELGLRLAAAMHLFWHMHGHGSEGARATTAQLGRSGTGEPTLVRARALAAAGGLLCQDAGELEPAAAHGEHALAIARSHNDDHVAAEALSALGWTRMRQGMAGEATALLQEGVAHARRAGDQQLLAKLLHGLGAMVVNTGSYPRELLQEAIRLHRARGDRINEARALDSLGVAALNNGDVGAARVHLESAARLGRELAVPRIKLNTLINLGLVAFLDGDNALAQLSFADALPLARDTEEPAVPYVLLGLALTTATTDPEEAARLHGAVDRLLEESGEHLERLEARLREESRQQLKALLGEESFQDAIEVGRAQQIDVVISAAIERSRLQNPLIPA